MMTKLMKMFLIAIGMLAFPAIPAHAVGGGVVSILKCLPGPVQQVDPIVSPGGALSEHMHQFFGGKGIQPPGTETTVAGMQTGGTTCPLSSDTAGYWVPTLHRADGTVIAPTQMNIYYRSPKGKTVQAFPEGFGMVCGIEPRPGCEQVETQGGSGWGCSDSEGFHSIAEALPCSSVLIGHVQMKPIDQTLPKVTLHVRYKLTTCDGCYISSDMGAPGGSTLHGDFWNTWDQGVLARVVAALNAGKSCKGMTDKNLSCLPVV